MLRPLYHRRDQILYRENTAWHTATCVNRIAQRLKEIEHLEQWSNRLVFAQINCIAQTVEQYEQLEQLEQLMYIYGLECLYEAFVLHSR